MDWLLDPFASGITQRALAEVLLVGLVCGPLGVWVVLYRSSYAAESLSHGLFPGVVLAALIGAPIALGAGAGALVAAAAITLANRDERVGPDVAVAVAVTGLFGLGGLLALSPEVPPRVEGLLFGDPLGVTGGDVALAALLVVVLSAALLASHRTLSLGIFDAAAARSLGVRVARAELLLLILLGVATVVAIEALGSLLAVALVLAPAAAALNVTERLAPALAIAAVVALLSGVAGLFASFHLNIAAGAAVALAAVALYGVSVLGAPAVRRVRAPLTR